jgi:hypothetical protein
LQLKKRIIDFYKVYRRVINRHQLSTLFAGSRASKM